MLKSVTVQSESTKDGVKDWEFTIRHYSILFYNNTNSTTQSIIKQDVVIYQTRGTRTDTQYVIGCPRQ